MLTIALLKNLLDLINNCNWCREVVKLTHLLGKNGSCASASVHLTWKIAPNPNTNP